jgi:hypothetical protein
MLVASAARPRGAATDGRSPMSTQPAVLITEEYRKAQQELHRNPHYGMASVQYAPLVAEVLDALGVDELLDYGAGKGRLGQSLPKHSSRSLRIHHYDPAIPQWSAMPQPCGFVACIDVLEHIEPELIDNVLDDLQRVTVGTGLFTVHTGPAMKVLGDGRNAHLIQQPPSWWLPRFTARFELIAFSRMDQGFWVLVESRRSAVPSGAVTHTKSPGLVSRLTALLLRRHSA